MLQAFADHLWQSSLFVLLAGVATLLLKRHAAHLRYWLWFAASMKFLLPFAVISWLGMQISWIEVSPAAGQGNWQQVAANLLSPASTLNDSPRPSLPERPGRTNPTGASAAVISTAGGSTTPGPAGSLAQQLMSQSDSVEPDSTASTPTDAGIAPASGPASRIDALLQAIPATLAAIWAVGFFLVLFRWSRCWQSMRTLVRNARDITIEEFDSQLPPIKSSASIIEPGVFGILHPVLLIPEGIVERLSSRQLQAIVQHELVHIRRRDNLTASLHMLVEALFWFHPFVWWIGARLIEERERACDEAVLAAGTDANQYASGLIQVCEHFMRSPLLCAAGVSGGSLEERIKRIADEFRPRPLSKPGLAALAASPAALLLVPLILGILQTQSAQAQAQAQADQSTPAAAAQAIPNSRPTTPERTDLLQCVDPDVLAGLVLHGSVNNTVISEAMPSALNEVTWPDEFEWIGSLTRTYREPDAFTNTHQWTESSFSTELEPDAAMEAAWASLSAAGWNEPRRTLARNTTENDDSNEVRSLMGCREEESIRGTAVREEEKTFVSFHSPAPIEPLYCSQDPRASQLARQRNAYAPDLSLPTDPATGASVDGRELGNGSSQSRMEVYYDGSLTDLTGQMSNQLVAQGWSIDVDWQGATTAGSSWLRSTDDQTRLQGTLDVTEMGSTVYTVMFRTVELR